MTATPEGRGFAAPRSDRSRRRLPAVLLALAVVLVAALAAPVEATGRRSGTVVVANRGSGDLTLIDTATDAATTVALPPGAADPEPMYVVNTAGRVLVGDRANDRVVAYDPVTWEVVGEAPTGAGVFHMWADPTGRQLWVNNDIDHTITVIRPRTLEVLATIDLPADLVAAGGTPHDVILDRFSAWVTVVGLEDDDGGSVGVVLRYDLRRFRERARAEVGGDPHVTVDPRRGSLFVASQDTGELVRLDRRTLRPLGTTEIPATHGLDIDRTGRVVYTTNLTGGGVDALWTVDARTGEVIGDPVDTAAPVPHNIVLTAAGDKLYVTHSGATADQVSVFTIDRRDPVPVPAGAVTAGTNPFGLEFVPGPRGRR